MNRDELKQRLIELYEECMVMWHDNANIPTIVAHLIANGVTIRERGEWVPVTERLPNKRDLERSQFHNFLVANEFGEVREAVFTGKHFAKLGSRLSGVTHWMPLPEPPETEKGGE